MRAFVFGAVHIIGLSPAPSSALVINVPSTFDTNIYTAHNARSETHPALRTPSHVHRGKLPSVRFVTACTKTSLGEGRRGMERKGKEGRKEEAKGCFICLKWDWGHRVARALFLHRDWELKRRLGERKMGENLNDKTRCSWHACDTPLENENK